MGAHRSRGHLWARVWKCVELPQQSLEKIPGCCKRKGCREGMAMKPQETKATTILRFLERSGCLDGRAGGRERPHHLQLRRTTLHTPTVSPSQGLFRKKEKPVFSTLIYF